MAKKVTTASIQLSFSEMMGTINNDLSNISLLRVDYAERCQKNMIDPEKMMKERKEKVFSKY